MTDFSTVTEQGSMLLLQNVAQALPTNPITDLAVQALTPVPSNPASPLTASPMTPLAVAAPKQQTAPVYVPPPASPTKGLLVWGAVAAAAYFLFFHKK
jgi:hypothetical protein